MPPHLEDMIRERAYHVWLAGGCRQGDDQHNWLLAEREVLSMAGPVEIERAAPVETAVPAKPKKRGKRAARR